MTPRKPKAIPPPTIETSESALPIIIPVVTTTAAQPSVDLVNQAIANLTVAAPKRELTMIERVSLMHDLASAAKDGLLKSEILNREAGEEIYRLFVDAIEKRLGQLMGTVKDAELAVALDEAAKGAIMTLQNVRDSLGGLSEILRRMGGGQPQQQAHRGQGVSPNSSHQPARQSDLTPDFVPGL